jgi:hypothetical protein
MTLAAAAAACLVGLLFVRLAPSEWRLDPSQGMLLGTALYMGVLHRWIGRREPGTAGGPRTAGGLLWRAALFLAIVAGQAYVYFEWLPASDMRAPFVMLSGWIVAETLLSPREMREAGVRASGSWPRA